ncbi:M16 family metallopeptidase [Roseitranquillus sediminis]|uniref:M16 family metallopeptidase n=1 Tax=Roseitranquillus sediminis TaxID=2809051 RepID=UPI00387366EF
MRAMFAAAFSLVALPALAAVEIQEVTSPGGIDAWLVEEHSIPFVALEIRFQGGASLDAEGKRGAINLMTGLLEEGAGDRDAQEFAAEVEGLAASFSFDVYDDALSVSARFLTENRDEAVTLLHEALTEPRFDEGAIERVRSQVLSIIQSDATDPSSIASQTFDGLAYGAHPYGSDTSGTVESVSALTRDDLIEAHGRVLAKDRLFVSAVGDITPDELGEMLDSLFDGLPAEGAPMPPSATFELGQGVTVVDFDTPQSVVRFGQPGIDRDSPDFFAAYVVNQVFGDQSFGSRLMREVREKRGLTYGIGTYLVNQDYSDTLLGQVASGNESVAEAIDVVRDEWARLSEEGVTEAELEAAKTYLTGAYPLRFDGNGPIARILVGMQMEGLPPSYVNTRNDIVEAVTLEDANRVAAELWDPESLHFVVVGQPEGLSATN